jgi:hypothetical protein
VRHINLKIKQFNIQKKKLRKNILVVGSGRWAKISIKEISKNFKNIKIYCYTHHTSQLLSWCKNKKIKIFFLKKIEDLKKYNISHSLVLNKNEDHYAITKKLLDMKIKILVEKPIVEKLSEFQNLLKYSIKNKTNLLISLPFFYGFYFYYYKKFIHKKKISLIKFFWTEPRNLVSNGLIKKHQSIHYFLDTIYHVHSIASIFLNTKNLSFNIKNFIKKNIFTIQYHKIPVEVFCKRNFKNRRRELEIYSNNNKKIKVDFSNNYLSKAFIYNQDEKIKVSPKRFQNLTLAYQIFDFLNVNKYTQIMFNDIRNLKSFLFTKFKIQKYL